MPKAKDTSDMDTPRPLSALIAELRATANENKESISLKRILDVFHERGFGVLLFLLALPAALPVPALGINVIIALPILILTLQQSIGRRTVWMPETLKKRQIKKKHLIAFLDKGMPLVRFTEIFFKPRLGFITQGFFSLLIGILGTVFALSITLPIPLTNTVPAMAVALMAIGVIMRDGLAVLCGAVLGCAWVSALIYFALVFGENGLILFKNMIKGILGL